MEFQKFKKIIEYNKSIRKSINEKVKDFYMKAGMGIENELLNLMQITREVFVKNGYIVAEIPFRDKEIGAICFNSDILKYALINSALPKVNENFALCHEIYHVLFQEKHFRQNVELYMSSRYFEHEEEMTANAFAGSLLMPEMAFKKMFAKFFEEGDNGDKELSTIIKLMNYYEAPYMSVLIRCFELDLLDDGENLKKLLNIGYEEITDMFMKYWLNDAILEPTMQDQYPKLKTFVSHHGRRLAEKDLINEAALDKVLDNMQELYGKIRSQDYGKEIYRNSL